MPEKTAATRKISRATRKISRRSKKLRPKARPASSRPNRVIRTADIEPAAYRPYHPRGEVTFLLAIALAAVIFFAWPMDFYWKLLGSVLLLMVGPVIIIKQYWPGLALRQLGWRTPAHPRLPYVYSAVVIILSFAPLLLYEAVSDPGQYAAVNPQLGWIEWLIGQGLVAIVIMAQTAFFSGLLLFRLAHLMRPWAAIIMIGLLMSVANLVVPGAVKYLALPLFLALAWMAWQTKSVVPATATQILLTLIYDLLVRLTF